jgi:penicillin-binding protein 2
MAIGQGYMQVTPLQLLRMATVFANGGKLVTPHLLKLFSEENPNMVGIDPVHLDLIRSGMRAAVTRVQGTAHVLSYAPFSIAAKTGTAQDPPRKDAHSWLVAFAPFDSPKVAVVVFLENIPDDQPKAVNMAADVFALPWMKGYILGVDNKQ